MADDPFYAPNRTPAPTRQALPDSVELHYSQRHVALAGAGGLMRFLLLFVLLPSLSAAQVVRVDPIDAPMGTAAASWTEVGCPGQTLYTPAQHDLVVHYTYASSLECGARKYFSGLWGYNLVIHSKGRDVGLSGFELDLQNETARPSSIPFAYVGGYSKTGFSSVLGGGGFDGTCAFCASLNYPTGWGDARWMYGFWSAGNRWAGFMSARHTNQNGWVDPDADFSADTNSRVLLSSRGFPQYYVTTHTWNVRPGHMQMGSGAFGPGWGAIIEVGRNIEGPCGAAGTIALIDKNGGLHMLWVDASGNLRLNQHAPTADCAIPDTAGRVIQ